MSLTYLLKDTTRPLFYSNNATAQLKITRFQGCTGSGLTLGNKK